MTLGLPYARAAVRAGRLYHVCPVCEEPIEEQADAQGEPTSSAYAEHYEAEHGAEAAKVAVKIAAERGEVERLIALTEARVPDAEAKNADTWEAYSAAAERAEKDGTPEAAAEAEQLGRAYRAATDAMFGTYAAIDTAKKKLALLDSPTEFLRRLTREARFRILRTRTSAARAAEEGGTAMATATKNQKSVDRDKVRRAVEPQVKEIVGDSATNLDDYVRFAIRIKLWADGVRTKPTDWKRHGLAEAKVKKLYAAFGPAPAADTNGGSAAASSRGTEATPDSKEEQAKRGTSSNKRSRKKATAAA